MVTDSTVALPYSTGIKRDRAYSINKALTWRRAHGRSASFSQHIHRVGAQPRVAFGAGYLAVDYIGETRGVGNLRFRQLKLLLLIQGVFRTLSGEKKSCPSKSTNSKQSTVVPTHPPPPRRRRRPCRRLLPPLPRPPLLELYLNHHVGKGTRQEKVQKRARD